METLDDSVKLIAVSSILYTILYGIELYFRYW